MPLEGSKLVLTKKAALLPLLCRPDWGRTFPPTPSEWPVYQWSSAKRFLKGAGMRVF